MSTHPKLITLTIVLILTAACGSTAPTPMPAPPTDIPSPTSTTSATLPGPSARTGSAGPPGTGSVARTLLTYDDLMNGFDGDSPVDEAALSLPADAAPPEHTFKGRLELRGEDTTGEMTVLRRGAGRIPPARVRL